MLAGDRGGRQQKGLQGPQVQAAAAAAVVAAVVVVAGVAPERA